MQEIERLEELKRAMIAKVFYRDAIPDEIMEVIQEAFDGILNRYKELHCDNLSIQEYIQGNLKYVKSYITNNLEEKRKESQIEQVEYIVRRMESELEDLDISLEDKRRNQEIHKEEICQIEPEDQEVSIRILDVVEDSLKDIQSKQSVILDVNGMSMERIEQIRQYAQEFIRNFVTRNEKRVYEILRRDNNSLKEQLVSDYEEYLLQNRNNEEKEQTNKSRREEFVAGLNIGISLEEQRAFSGEQTKGLEQKKEEQGKQEELPGDIIK